MIKNPQVFVNHILTEIEILNRLVKENTPQSLVENDISYRAAIYSIQIISEAVRNLPNEWMAEFPLIPWPDIKSIGNWTRHEYYAINDELIWKVMTEDLTPFLGAIKKLQLRS